MVNIAISAIFLANLVISTVTSMGTNLDPVLKEQYLQTAKETLTVAQQILEEEEAKIVYPIVDETITE